MTSTRHYMPVRSRGFSLIELMVALTVGLILIVGLTSLVVGNIRGFGELNKASYQVENARFASQFLRDELAMSGYYGNFTFPSSEYSLPDDNCSTGQDDVAARIVAPVQALDDVTALTADDFECVGSMHILDGTDMLLLRRASTMEIDPVDRTDDAFYLATSSNRFNIVAGADSVESITYMTDARFANMREYFERIIYVSSCSVCSGAAADSIPTLKMIQLETGGWSEPVSLVEGVEQLQLEFGIDKNKDGYPDMWLHIPESEDEWEQLSTIRYHLLMRNAEASNGHTDSKVYALGLDGNDDPRFVEPIGDSFKRHVFSMTVRLRNIAERREKN